MDERIKAFQDAIANFSYLARLDLAELKQKLGDERLVDGMQNGRAQKFKYTTELCWKAIKFFLKDKEAMDDRNSLSHIYDAETFNNILSCLPGYASLFERISAQLTNNY